MMTTTATNRSITSLRGSSIVEDETTSFREAGKHGLSHTHAHTLSLSHTHVLIHTYTNNVYFSSSVSTLLSLSLVPAITLTHPTRINAPTTFHIVQWFSCFISVSFLFHFTFSTHSCQIASRETVVDGKPSAAIVK